MDTVIDQIFKVVPIQYLTFILSLVTIATLYYGIRPWLKELAGQVQQTNGSVRELKQWKADHDASDDDRHRENIGKFNEINETLRDLNNHSRK